MDNLLSLEPGMLVWTFITFGLLLYLLKKWGWKPLLNALESREVRIHSDLQRSQHAREESEKILTDHRKMMNNAELEARKIIDEAKKSAEKARTEIIAAAEEQTRQMTVQAKAEIQREKETALAQLRYEIAELAILAASKVLQESLDEERNRKIVDRFIAQLPRN